MLETLREDAISVVSHVFETMFFTFLEIWEDDNPSATMGPSSVILRGEIEFEGKQTGRLTLELPDELARTMAANFMGLEEEEVSESQTEDVVRELCNMISGNLFSKVDPKTVWSLTIPRAQRFSAPKWDQAMDSPGIAIQFDAGGHRVKLHLRITDEPSKSGSEE